MTYLHVTKAVPRCFAVRKALVPLLASAVLLSGCTQMGASGPSTGKVLKAGQVKVNDAQIQVVELDENSARQVIATNESRSFAEALGDALPTGSVAGPGDVLQILIWEAPPGVLFGTSPGGGGGAGASSDVIASGASTVPEQMVDGSGQIKVPYVGLLDVAGRSTRQIESDIVRRLNGKAHDPQAIVRIARNATANVTVMGDVATSARVPLTPKGERLLDIIAAVGGARESVSKTTVQITRGRTVATMPLQKVAQEPGQNIVMKADDVVNVMFQPYSFTALGAVMKSAEIPFEGTGISLAQALGRIGGLDDNRANIRGVFIFRLEDPAALSSSMAASEHRTLDGKVPVIYRLNLGSPEGFFLAQSFPVLNSDVIYVSNAPAVELQKFVGIVSSMTFSVIGIKNSL